MKKLINAAVLTLVFAFSIPVAYGNPMTSAGRTPRILGSVQFPRTRWRIVRHTFQLQIPQESSALSQLNIDVPAGLTVSNNIDVSDQSGLKIGSNISVDDRKVVLVFPEPVAPGTRLKIAMRDVKISGFPHIFLYPVSARLLGLNADISIGVARFHRY